MRVTGGLLKGRRILCPKGKLVRPTTDRVREALFHILSSNFYDDWQELKVLDLFSGTGSLGIEALSRGAGSCIFVEKAPQAITFLKRNLAQLALLDRAALDRKDVYRFLSEYAHRDGQVDLVLCDPPYAKGHFLRLVEFFSKRPYLLSSNGVLVIEAGKREDLHLTDSFNSIALIKSKQYGDTRLFFFRRNNAL